MPRWLPDVESRLKWGGGSDAHWGLGGIIDKSVQKFENYRHMLNADSDGGGGQIQMGAKGGRIK